MRFSRNWIAEYVDLPASQSRLVDKLSMLGLVVDDRRVQGDDLILDLDIASNRPDVMSHAGVARELAVALDAEWRQPGASIDEKETGPSVTDSCRIEIADPHACNRFVARLITGVEVGPSPDWLARRLEGLGMRPINNVVDITNFVLWEMGRPLHAYDYDKLVGSKLVVRRANTGERLVTLDEVDRSLTIEDLVIADATKPVGLAGVMGGLGTGVREGATRVLLEGASFDRVVVRRMSKRHGLHTDASHRFERGLSHTGMVPAIDRAAALIAELGGGLIACGNIDAVGETPPARHITLRRSRLRGLLGVSVDGDAVRNTLSRLGFAIGTPEEADGVGPTDTGASFDVEVPFDRADVTLEVDLIEEIARFHGYDRLPSTLPTIRALPEQRSTRALRAERHVRSICGALGFWEAMTFSFTSAAEQMLMAPESAIVALGNPLSDAMSVMRVHALPGLLTALARNRNHGTSRVRLFEIGHCFENRSTDSAEAPGSHESGDTGKSPGTRQSQIPGARDANAGAADDPVSPRPSIVERRHLALVVAGPAEPRHWSRDERPAAHVELRGALDALTERMRWPAWTWQQKDFIGLQPGTSAALRRSSLQGPESPDGVEKTFGYVGQLHAKAAHAFGLETGAGASNRDQQVWVAEVDVEELLARDEPDLSYRRLPRFPAADRDLSIQVPSDVDFAAVKAQIAAVEGIPLAEVTLLDVYHGDDLPAGHRSLTLRLVYRADDRTLTSEEVEAAHDAVWRRLETQLGVKRR